MHMPGSLHCYSPLCNLAMVHTWNLGTHGCLHGAGGGRGGRVTRRVTAPRGQPVACWGAQADPTVPSVTAADPGGDPLAGILRQCQNREE